MIVPLLLIKLVHRRRIRDHGRRLEGFSRHVWIYLGLFVLMVPVVYWRRRARTSACATRSSPLECFAAILAGVLLGGMALRFRSWYGGAVLHGLVAVTMDGLAFSRAAG